MIFFTDRDLGSTFPRILSEKGLHIERHADHFGDTTPDADWLSEVGRRGWFAISRDKNIRYRPNERDAAMRAGVGLFIVIGSLPHETLANNFVASTDSVERFLKKNDRPFIAKVYQPSPGAKRKTGRVELWLSYEEWLEQQRQLPPDG